MWKGSRNKLEIRSYKKCNSSILTARNVTTTWIIFMVTFKIDSKPDNFNCIGSNAPSKCKTGEKWLFQTYGT